jgi:hypothetical protein
MRLEVQREKLNAQGELHGTFFCGQNVLSFFIMQSKVRPGSNVCVAMRVNIFFCISNPGPMSVMT